MHGLPKRLRLPKEVDPETNCSRALALVTGTLTLSEGSALPQSAIYRLGERFLRRERNFDVFGAFVLIPSEPWDALIVAAAARSIH